jgi:hypothetical protein
LVAHTLRLSRLPAIAPDGSVEGGFYHIEDAGQTR